jgi:peptidoglycan/xylan/chitin deacetylase (PgdA/CDA1 family)
MTIRHNLRRLLIQAATLVRADELALRVQNRQPSPFGLVVGMHETPVSFEAQFRRQLEWVSQHFTITSLEGFAGLWEKQKTEPGKGKPPVLFTFDEGRESNYAVAAPLLESFGGRGAFFIVPDFAECSGDDARRFYQSRISPSSDPARWESEEWKPMSPAQIADLAARGHAVGNHTLTHQRLVGLSPEALEREIGDSARRLSAWTKKPVDAFAWTFDWNAVDANAWSVIRRYHRFCFAPCPGLVDSRHDTPALLWRREIEVKYSEAECRFLYSGLVDLWWSTRRRRLRRRLRISPAASTTQASEK